MSFNPDSQKFTNQVIITDTTNAGSTSGSLVVQGGVSAKDTYVTGHVAVNNVKITPNLNDIIYELQATLTADTATMTNITDFTFNSSVARTFKAFVNVSVSAAESKYALWEINGVYKPTGWVIYTSFTGDITGVNFGITTNGDGVGQVQYTNSNGLGSTTIIRYRANTTAPAGSSPTGSTGIINNTSGPYIENAVVYSNSINTLANADASFSNNVFAIGDASRLVAKNSSDTFQSFSNGGSLTAYGGASVAKNLIVGEKIGIGRTAPGYAIDIGGDINFTGSLYNNGSVYSGSSVWGTNGTNVFYTAGNLGIGTTSPDYKLDVVGNIRATAISTGEVNVTSITAGTLTATSGTLPNLVNTNITTTSIMVTGGGLRATFNSNTVGSIFTTGGNVGIDTTSPTAKLSVNGSMTVNGNITGLPDGAGITFNIGKIYKKGGSGLQIVSGFGDTQFRNYTDASTTMSISEDGNLSVTTSVSSANMAGLNVSAGTLNATTLVSSANMAANLITAGTLNAATLVSSANLSGLNISAGSAVITNASSTNLSAGTAQITNVVATNSSIGSFRAGAGTIGGHLVPSTNVTYDLGSSSLRWKDLYLSGNTIYLGDKQLSLSGDMFTVEKVNVTSTAQSTSSADGALTVAGGLGVTKNVNVGGDITVTGNLTINGTTTTVNTETQLIEDNLIVVNSGPAGLADGGMLIKRYVSGTSGSVNYAGVFYSEANDEITLALTNSDPGASPITVDSYLPLRAGGVNVTNVTTSTLIASTLVSSANLAGLNVSAGTLRVTTLVSSANIGANLVTTGTLRTTNLISNTSTLGDIFNTNIYSSGLITSNNLSGLNVTAGTLRADTLVSSANVAGLNISAGTLNATTLMSSANVAGLNVTAGTLMATNVTVGTSLIVSTGNIGIRTASPGADLHIVDSSPNTFTGGTTLLTLERPGPPGVAWPSYVDFDVHRYNSTSGTTDAFTQLDLNLTNWQSLSRTNVMTLRANGNVGIGTTAPAFILDVVGTARFSTGLTTGTLTATSSTIPNTVSTNISTGTLSATSSTVPNAVSTNISTGTIRASGVGYYSDNITFPIGKGISFNNGYKTNNGSYALYADNVASNSPIRLVGSSDSGIQRPFQIGHFSSDNAASTWNSQFSVNTFSGSLTASFNSNTIGNIITTGGNVGIGTATPTRQLSLTGDFGMDNAKVMYAKNSAGTEEIFFWPRWTDNMTYLNYGSGGFNIRNNTSTTIMFLTNGGNVGIGTQSPGVKLDVVGGPYDPTIRCNSSKDAIISLKATNNRDYWIGSGADTGGIPAPLANNCFFIYDNTAGAVRFVVDSTGSIGIGTTSPTYKLDVNGTTRLNSTVLVGGRFEIDTTRFVVGVDGNVGIGTASPQGKLDVVGSTSSFSIFRGGASDANSKTTLNAVNANCMLMSSMSGSTMFFYGRDTGTNYRNTWAASTYFTGQHGNKPIDGEEYLKSNLTDYVGLIVSSADDGFYSVNPITKEELTGKDAINISEALPKIKLTTVDQDKSVWGVITNVKNDNYNVDGTFDTDDNTEWSDRLEGSVRINGLGEGAIWISNINGNIENGDYICSSLIPGYGKRQNDDLLHNYTVAKATCSVNFTNLEELETKFNLRYLQPDGTLITKQEYLSGLASNENVYIAAFIGCTYHCS